MWEIHITEYYLGIKRSEAQTHDIMWLNRKNMMLSQRSQHKKVTYCRIPFIQNVHTRHRDRTQAGGCQVLRGGGNGEWWLNGHGILIRSDENGLELDKSGGCTTLCVYLMPLNVHIKMATFMLCECHLKKGFFLSIIYCGQFKWVERPRLRVKVLLLIIQGRPR